MRILLVISPQEYGYGYINTYFWQQGVLHLTAYIQNVFGNSVEVDICDGNLRSMKECRQLILDIAPEIIGFHCVDHTKHNTIELAKYAIANGCRKILFGGAGAIFGPTQYLLPLKEFSRSTLIACTVGAGEECLAQIIRGAPLMDVPNLVFLQNDEILKSQAVADKPKDKSYLNNIPFSRYSDISKYITLQLNSIDFPYYPVTYSALSHEGCIHRFRIGDNVVKGCSFCAIPAPVYQPREPHLFWNEVSKFNMFCKESFGVGVSSLKDWGDSMSIALLRRVLRARPDNLNQIKYSCYLSISEVTRDALDLLTSLNCFSIYVGIDGTDATQLEKLKKSYKFVELMSKLELINKYDFSVEIGTILGVENDTLENLSATVEFIKKIKAMFEEKVIVLQGNILVPMPGSRVFQILRKRTISEEGVDPLYLNVQERARLWMRYFTQVTFEDCIHAQETIEMISPRKHSYAGQTKY